MANLIIKILFILIPAFYLYSQDKNAADSLDISDRIPVNFYIQAGGVLTTGGVDFFDTYFEYLGGKKQQFKKTPSMYIGSRLMFSEHFRVNISAGYFTSNLEESYFQEYTNRVESGNRRILQSITLRNIPLVASLEYTPFNMPYKTFVGIGAGVDFGSLKWEENIQPGSVFDQRVGGDWSHNSLISPLLRLSSGINLMFDRHHPEYILQNFLIEVRYNLLYRKKDFFSGINKQFLDSSEELNDAYYLMPAYLELVIGASLNFEAN